MQILLIGASGTIGSAVREALEARGHRVIKAGRSGEESVDLADVASIRALFARLGQVDALVCAAGSAPFGGIDDIDDAGWATGLESKLMGQVNLVRFGRESVTGSFTLTSGMFAESASAGSTALSTTNAGIQGFARSAALQIPQRVNVVSPPLVRETALKLGWGPKGVPAATVAESYVEAVEGEQSGVVLRAGWSLPEVGPE